MRTTRDFAAIETLSCVTGQLQVTRDLLDFFYGWYEDSHKALNIDRSYTPQEISDMWSKAPQYFSIIQSVYSSLEDLQKDVDAAIDAYNARCSKEDVA